MDKEHTFAKEQVQLVGLIASEIVKQAGQDMVNSGNPISLAVPETKVTLDFNPLQDQEEDATSGEYYVNSLTVVVVKSEMSNKNEDTRYYMLLATVYSKDKNGNIRLRYHIPSLFLSTKSLVELHELSKKGGTITQEEVPDGFYVEDQDEDDNEEEDDDEE